jgi:long-chain acyl-CoA synthetase
MNKQKYFFLKIKKKKNFSEIIEFVATFYPNKIFLVKDRTNVDFLNFNLKINRVCNLFLKKKIKKGSVISLYFKNSIEFVILYFAIIRYGCIVSPIPYGVSNEKIKYYLNLSKSKLIISDILIKNKNNIIFKDYQDFERNILNFPNKFVHKIKDNKSTCVYYFSSGTTANPKLIKYSHYAMVSCQKLLINERFLDLFSNHLCILPLGHTASLRYTIKNAIYCCGTVHIYKNFWELKDSFWKIINKFKINFVGVVPSILEAIFSLYKKKKKIKYLKYLGCGSSTLNKQLQIDFYNKFKINIRNIYGMSEIGVVAIDNPKIDKVYGTIGKPIKGVNIKLIDKNNKFIKKNNKIGEMVVKTPAIFNGYIEKNSSIIRRNFIGNYFKTGDLAKKINKNLIFIDRSKDIIIKGGVNISPQEIDDCLKKNSFVKESKSVGIKDKFLGEKIKSYVVLNPKKNISKQNLIEFCRKKIGNLRSPSEIEFLSNLPKTASGKVIKRYL